jgi:hypothetical protein
MPIKGPAEADSAAGDETIFYYTNEPASVESRNKTSRKT